MMMMTDDGNDMSNLDFDYHLLPTKVKTSLISSELPLFAEKPVLVASLAMAGPQTNLKRSTFQIENWGQYSLLSLLWFDLKWRNFCKKSMYSHRLVHVIRSHSRVETHIFFWVPQLALYTQHQSWNNFSGSISIMPTMTIMMSIRPERWIVTIPSSDQWLATIGNHWKTIASNGFWTKIHWKTIATNGFGDQKPS